ncbi:hypothetical protein AV530_009938 [Patagioenas fasciata monilis]|uniref:Uncharacterized protein n=1 Tax=Patagioenas fasciata monilis TaxID=372326 RepID=A0A1V4KAT9_PATFA|nr:hypothetical protein AV530_009938 [Patagioenas fasciata monilis]
MSLFCSGRGRKPEVRLVHATEGAWLFPETCCTSFICTCSVVNLQSRNGFQHNRECYTTLQLHGHPKPHCQSGKFPQ